MASYAGDTLLEAARELGAPVLACEFCDTRLGVGGGSHDVRVPGATFCRDERCLEERAGLTDQEIANVIAAQRVE